MAHAPASASTPGAPSPDGDCSYDVFINHCGADVKKTVASHLYYRLLCCGFRVFLDQPELRRGEKIDPQVKEAIATASVQVAIFSPRYAASRWCLDELVLMLRTGTTVIPVFYNVKPSDLRWTDYGKNNDRVYAEALRILQQTGRYRVFIHALKILWWTGKDIVYVQALRNFFQTGSHRVYAEALFNHEKKGRYNPERFADWRRALCAASQISGFELKAFNGDEGELMEKVALRVQNTVDKNKLRYDSKTIESWRNTLSTAADLSNFNLGTSNSDKDELEEEIPDFIRDKVPKIRSSM